MSRAVEGDPHGAVPRDPAPPISPHPPLPVPHPPLPVPRPAGEVRAVPGIVRRRWRRLLSGLSSIALALAV
ncbi:MAG TPA: hypothetical protein VIR33_07020, partial [Thermopolyspora sp.]